MRVPALVIAMLLANGAAFAKGSKGDGKPTTIEGALADAEAALDAGRLGDAMSESEKLSWRMPPLALLKPVKWSPGLRVGMLSLRAYLVVAAVLLVVKAVQLGGG